MVSNLYTKQEAFDVVLKNLRIQGEPSMEPYVEGLPIVCRYRGPNGLKCAAGHLLRDEYYNEESMEGDISIPIPPNLFNMRYTDANSLFIREMQIAHDSAASDSARFKNKNWLNEFEIKMQDIAEQYKLKYIKTE